MMAVVFFAAFAGGKAQAQFDPLNPVAAPAPAPPPPPSRARPQSLRASGDRVSEQPVETPEAFAGSHLIAQSFGGPYPTTVWGPPAKIGPDDNGTTGDYLTDFRAGYYRSGILPATTTGPMSDPTARRRILCTALLIIHADSIAIVGFFGPARMKETTAPKPWTEVAEAIWRNGRQAYAGPNATRAAAFDAERKRALHWAGWLRNVMPMGMSTVTIRVMACNHLPEYQARASELEAIALHAMPK